MASSTPITHLRQLVYKKPQFAQPPTATQLGLLRRSRIYPKLNSTVMVLGQELSIGHAGAREFSADMPMNKSSSPSEENRRAERHTSGEAKGFVDDMRAVAMTLHTRDQAREGEKTAKGPEERTPAMWKPTVDGYLKFLVDSKLVYETLESIVEQATVPYYAVFRNTGLERSEKLVRDLEWFEEQDHDIPEPSNPGRTYAKHLQELSEKDPQAFICHFYNVYFAHSAGGRMIGRKVADAILNKKELEFYKWDGDLPKLLQTVRDNLNKVAETTTSSCQYTVFITTSCSSTKYTRDYISISFGDAYGNQVYVPRLDDSSSHTFESCSSDTFQINGPCTYGICYLYLLRNGYDGWKPDYVEIYSPYGGAVKFTYNTFLPNDAWYGFNYCSGSSSQGCNKPQRIICQLTLLALLFLVEWR